MKCKKKRLLPKKVNYQMCGIKNKIWKTRITKGNEYYQENILCVESMLWSVWVGFNRVLTPVLFAPPLFTPFQKYIQKHIKKHGLLMGYQ